MQRLPKRGLRGLAPARPRAVSGLLKCTISNACPRLCEWLTGPMLFEGRDGIMTGEGRNMVGKDYAPSPRPLRKPECWTRPSLQPWRSVNPLTRVATQVVCRVASALRCGRTGGATTHRARSTRDRSGSDPEWPNGSCRDVRVHVSLSRIVPTLPSGPRHSIRAFHPANHRGELP